MSRFKNAMKTLGTVVEAYADRSSQIEEMTRELNKRAYDADPVELRKIATVLVDRAEVTWK